MTRSFLPENGLLLNLIPGMEPQRSAYKEEYLSPYVNTDGAAAWILQAKFNKSDAKLKLMEPEKGSLWIWHEWPEALLEYAD